MDRTKLIHRAFVALNLGALMTGLGRDNFSGITLNVLLLFFLMLALRVKFWADDEAYFEDVEKGKLEEGLPFYFGFALAMASWIVWLFAGFWVKHLETSSLLMSLALIPSTFWIVATMVSKGAYDEQVPWLFFNVFYVLGFALIFVGRSSWNPYSSAPDKYFTTILILLIVLFFLDLIATRIIEQRRRKGS
ncbi:MAG: hypothetical protein WAN65_15030 [Candidatus Sulfotelmatobacter sp.]